MANDYMIKYPWVVGVWLLAVCLIIFAAYYYNNLGNKLSVTRKERLKATISRQVKPQRRDEFIQANKKACKKNVLITIGVCVFCALLVLVKSGGQLIAIVPQMIICAGVCTILSLVNIVHMVARNKKFNSPDDLHIIPAHVDRINTTRLTTLRIIYYDYLRDKFCVNTSVLNDDEYRRCTYDKGSIIYIIVKETRNSLRYVTVE